MNHFKVVYISGPYRIDKEKAILAFRKATEDLWAAGFVPIDPIALTCHLDGKFPDDDFIERDKELVSRCDAIFLLPGWQESEGAKVELETAHIYEMPSFESIEEIVDFFQKKS